MRAWVSVIAVLGLAILMVGPSCVAGNPCGMESVPIVSDDGGVRRCVFAEECPRLSGTLVCETDADDQRECVRCLETVCVRQVPRTCL